MGRKRLRRRNWRNLLNPETEPDMNTTYPYMDGYDAWKLSAPDEPSPCNNCPRRNARGVDADGDTECDICARTEADDER